MSKPAALDALNAELPRPIWTAYGRWRQDRQKVNFLGLTH
jgi:hypothetical protein